MLDILPLVCLEQHTDLGVTPMMVFMKDLEKFLSHHDVTELRRRELLHKRWTERTWLPLQRRVEERVSSCSPVVGKMHQSLCSNNRPHCNTKVMQSSQFSVLTLALEGSQLTAMLVLRTAFVFVQMLFSSLSDFIQMILLCFTYYYKSR